MNGFRVVSRGWGARFARWVWSFALIRGSLLRALMTSVALSAGALLAGCNSDEIGSLATNAKANQPVSPKLVAATRIGSGAVHAGVRASSGNAMSTTCVPETRSISAGVTGIAQP